MSELTATGPVTEMGQTKSGKSKFKIAGQWYFPGRLKTLPSVGQTIALKYTLFGDRGDLRSLEDWKPMTNGAAPSIPVSAGVDEASLRFISNVVGSAITAKTISEPGQIQAWYQAAKSALEGKAAPIPFDDSFAGYDDEH